MNAQEIIEAIENGEMTEKYDEWKNHKTNNVRLALASKGYFPEYFINDKINYVRRAVPKHHPEYYAQVLKDPSNDHWCYNAIMNEVFHEPNLTNETIDVATNMIKEKPALFNIELTSVSIYTKLLERKRIANKEVSVLEATMSPAQLFAARNDLWCKSYTVKEIQRIDNLRGIKHHNIEELEQFFQRENLNDYKKYGQLLQQYRARRRAEEQRRNRKGVKNECKRNNRSH